MKGFVQDIEGLAVKNAEFRRVLYTAKHCQLVLMALKPKEEIGAEVHTLDQFFRVEEGVTRCSMAVGRPSERASRSSSRRMVSVASHSLRACEAERHQRTRGSSGPPAVIARNSRRPTRRSGRGTAPWLWRQTTGGPRRAPWYSRGRLGQMPCAASGHHPDATAYSVSISFTVTRRFFSLGVAGSRSGPRPMESIRSCSTPCVTRKRRTASTLC